MSKTPPNVEDSKATVQDFVNKQHQPHLKKKNILIINSSTIVFYFCCVTKPRKSEGRRNSQRDDDILYSIENMYYRKYSLGQRPMACQISHQLLFCSSVVFSSLVRAREAAPGTLLAKNAPLGDHSRRQNRPYGAPRFDFFDFLVHQGGVQK